MTESNSCRILTAKTQYPMYRIEVPEPRMGSKCYLIERKGIYVLEVGEGVLRSIACTHIGSGSTLFSDGVPDEHGYFGNERMDPYSREYMTSNGRKLQAMSPQIIGFQALDAGFRHGLTVSCIGGTMGVPVFISVCWIKHKSRARTPVEMIG